MGCIVVFRVFRRILICIHSYFWGILCFGRRSRRLDKSICVGRFYRDRCSLRIVLGLYLSTGQILRFDNCILYIPFRLCILYKAEYRVNSHNLQGSSLLGIYIRFFLCVIELFFLVSSRIWYKLLHLYM